MISSFCVTRWLANVDTYEFDRPVFLITTGAHELGIDASLHSSQRSEIATHPGADIKSEERFAGKWTSQESVMASVKPNFFLDIFIQDDGTFAGTWEAYSFIDMNLAPPGPFVLPPIIPGWRSRQPEKVEGRFDFANRKGEIKLGESSPRRTLTIENISQGAITLTTKIDGDLFSSTIQRRS